MFKIYIKDNDKKVLGFCYHLFESMKFNYDYNKYDTVTDLEFYLMVSKSDVLGLNIDKFVVFCEQHINTKTILIEEAIEKLKKASLWRIKNKDKYAEFINLVHRGGDLFKTLVSAVNDDGKAEIMCLMILEFVNSELDDNKII